QPALVGEDRGRSSAYSRGGDRRGMRANSRLAMGFPMEGIRGSCEVDRWPAAPFAAGRIGEIKVAQRACLRPVSLADQALEDQHVLVLVIKDDVFEHEIQSVGRTVQRCRMTLRADRAGGHQPAISDLRDARILDAVALEA